MVINNSSVIRLSKRKSTDTVIYFIGLSIALILESAAVHFLARIWLSPGISLIITFVHFALGLVLLYLLFVTPAKTPHLLTGDTLIIQPGLMVKVPVPLSQIVSIENTRQGSEGLLFEKDEQLGIMFMLTGKSNKILLHLKEPVVIKGIRNYGYADKLVFNLDDPLLLKEYIEEFNINQQGEYVPAPALISGYVTEHMDKKNIHDEGKTVETGSVLTLDRISKRFGEATVVHDLSMNFYPGELFGLLGPNGAGKTTTLKMISGLLQPSSGEIRFGTSGMVAYMPEFMMLYDRMSAREFLEFLGVLYGVERARLKKEIEEYLARFDLAKAADRQLGAYSQGMKRKVSLIATLIKGSPVLLLDEPTNGLDPTGIIQVKELLREQAKAGKTVIMSTHILEMAEKLCDRVGIIAGGTLMFVGTLDELRERTQMRNNSLEDIFTRLIQGRGGEVFDKSMEAAGL